MYVLISEGTSLKFTWSERLHYEKLEFKDEDVKQNPNKISYKIRSRLIRPLEMFTHSGIRSNG